METHLLNILLCGAGDRVADVASELSHHPSVSRLLELDNLDEARRLITDGEINTVVLEPFSFGLGAAGNFVFSTRQQYPSIIFALYLDVAESERSAEFYQGQRQRFRHYFTLDRRTPRNALAAEVDAIVQACVDYLWHEHDRAAIDQLIDRTQHLAEAREDPELRRVAEELGQFRRVLQGEGESRPSTVTARPNHVFLSYRFAETDFVEGLTGMLEDAGFQVVTGRMADGYVSTAVLKRIRECEYFVCLMTRKSMLLQPDNGTEERWATSPWVIEEKGAAVALGKHIILLVEEGVREIGGLHGDLQRHNFTPRSFAAVARRVVRQMSAQGRPDDSL